jgi:hypothetical protein
MFRLRVDTVLQVALLEETEPISDFPLSVLLGTAGPDTPGGDANGPNTASPVLWMDPVRGRSSWFRGQVYASWAELQTSLSETDVTISVRVLWETLNPSCKGHSQHCSDHSSGVCVYDCVLQLVGCMGRAPGAHVTCQGLYII